MPEADFPRGGHMKVGSNCPVASKNIIKELSYASAIEKKKKKKTFLSREARQNLKRKSLTSSAKQFKVDYSRCMLLSKSCLVKGMAVLGIVEEVFDLHVKVSLPNHHYGIIPIGKVSDEYSLHVTEAAQTDKDLNSLHDLFIPGQMISCIVLSNEGNLIELDAVPSSVNSLLPLASLQPGILLLASIVSFEDHGCVMNIGIADKKGFVAKKNFPTDQIFGGQLFTCMVVSVLPDSPVVTMTADEKDFGKLLSQFRPRQNLHAIIPGSLVEAKVVKMLSSGLQVTVGNIVCNIHNFHLPQQCDQYKPNDQIRAVVLFKDPITKLASLSALPHLIKRELPQEDCLVTGLIVPDAEIIRVSKYVGLIVRLSGDCYGCAPRQKMANRKYEVGSRVRCRIVRFLRLERFYAVSLLKRDLVKPVFNKSEIVPGSIFSCEVERFNLTGVVVRVAGTEVSGFVPNNLLADRFIEDPKKLFHVGSKVNCKVVAVQENSVLFTAVPVIVQSKLASIVSYEDVQVGDIADGTVRRIHSYGLIISFCNNVRGLALYSRVAGDNGVLPDRPYFVGEPVRCRVVSVDPVNERMELSLKISDESYEIPSASRPLQLIIGKVYCCKVKEKCTDGFKLEVTLGKKKTFMFLPLPHLGDWPQLSAAVFARISLGDTLSCVLVSLKSNLPIVSLKEELLKLAGEKSLHFNLSNLHEGQELTGIVQNVTSHSVFVELLGGAVGVVRKSFVADELVDDASLYFDAGQTVKVRVVSVEEEKNHCYFSLRHSDVNYDSTELLQSFLHELALILAPKRLLESDGSICAVRPGTVVPISKVNQSKSDIISCKINKVLNGEVIFPGGVEEVSKMSCAVVVDVDLIRGSVKLFYEPATMKAMTKARSSKESFPPKMKPSIGLVLLIRPEFAIVLLKKSRLIGLLSLLDSITCSSRQSFAIGEKISVYFSRQLPTGEIMLRTAADHAKVLLPIKDGHMKKSREVSRKRKVEDENFHWEDKVVEKSFDNEEEREEPRKRKKGPKSSQKLQITSEDNALKCKRNVDQQTLAHVAAVELKKDKQSGIVGEAARLEESELDLKNNTSESETLQVEGGFDWGQKVSSISKNKMTRLNNLPLDESPSQLPLTLTNSQVNKSQESTEFERMILASPNSSIVWISYMAYHLQNRDVEKARVVAERALEMISFQEQIEKFNIWMALLNLENMHGSTATIDAVLKRALQYNDPLEVYRKFISIYVSSKKFNEAEQVYKTLTKRASQEKWVWLEFAKFYFGIGKASAARQLLDAALKCLQDNLHVDLIAQFAQLEFKDGEPEKGKTMYEKLLATYPMKCNHWTVYIDMLIKMADFHGARHVFERAIQVGLPAKKQKIIYKKFLSFEEKHGTSEQIEKLKEQILDYVEVQANSIE